MSSSYCLSGFCPISSAAYTTLSVSVCLCLCLSLSVSLSLSPANSLSVKLSCGTAYFTGVTKLEGFERAEVKTNIFSDGVLQQQCSVNHHEASFNFSSMSTTSFAFIPFYSKKPAGTVVNKDTKTLKVTSVGQGNSLVMIH